MRKTAGNVVELGSMAAFGFSPLWLLAAAADVTRGTRVYLDALVRELKAAGALRADRDPSSVDDLLAALEGASGATARMIDVPLELRALRRSLAEFRREPDDLPSVAELATAYEGLRATAERERSSLLEVPERASASRSWTRAATRRPPARARSVHPKLRARPRRGVRGLRRARVSRPYADAVAKHSDPLQPTLTRARHKRHPRD